MHRHLQRGAAVAALLWVVAPVIAPAVAVAAVAPEQQFAIELRSQVSGGIAGGLDLQVSGTLAWAHLANGRERMVLRQPRVDDRHTGPRTGIREVPGLDQPFFVERDSRGVPVRLTFAAAVPAATRQLLQFATGALMVVTVDRRQRARGGVWTATERDGTGAYRARYQSERTVDAGRVLVRRKTDPVARPGSGSIEIKSSVARFVLDADDSVREVTIDEELTIAQVGTTSLTHFSARRSGPGTQAPGPDAPATGAPGWRTFALGEAGVASQEERDRTLVNVSAQNARPLFDEILTKLGATGQASAQAAELERLMALLRLAPALLQEARARLAAGGATAEWIIIALARAGSPEAQQTLAAVLTDGKVPAPLRQRAAAESMRALAPTLALVAALESIASGAESSVSETALVALGAAAFHLQGREPNEAHRVVGGLLARLRKSAGRDRVTIAQALGNSGITDALPDLVSLATGDKDPVVRATSVRALRLMKSDRAVQTIDRVMRKDADASVRVSAVLATTDHGFAPHRAALLETIQRDTDASVRRTAASVLERWPTEPAARQALERAATHDPDAEVKTVARRSLRKT